MHLTEIYYILILYSCKSVFSPLISPTQNGTDVEVSSLKPHSQLPPRPLLHLKSLYLFHVLSQRKYLGLYFLQYGLWKQQVLPNIIYEATGDPVPIPLVCQHGVPRRVPTTRAALGVSDLF